MFGRRVQCDQCTDVFWKTLEGNLGTDAYQSVVKSLESNQLLKEDTLEVVDSEVGLRSRDCVRHGLAFCLGSALSEASL